VEGDQAGNESSYFVFPLVILWVIANSESEKAETLADILELSFSWWPILRSVIDMVDVALKSYI
jgi:hypothetical protein